MATAAGRISTRATPTIGRHNGEKANRKTATATQASAGQTGCAAAPRSEGAGRKCVCPSRIGHRPQLGCCGATSSVSSRRRCGGCMRRGARVHAWRGHGGCRALCPPWGVTAGAAQHMLRRGWRGRVHGGAAARGCDLRLCGH